MIAEIYHPSLSEQIATTPGALVVFTGPSGAGKDTLLELLLQERSDISRIVTDTTRPPRTGEVDGVHYNFLTESDFMRRVHLERYRYPSGWKGSPLESVLRVASEPGIKTMTLDLSAAGNLEAIIRANCDETMVRQLLPRITTICIGVPRLTVLHDRMIRRANPNSPFPVRHIGEQMNLFAYGHHQALPDIRDRLRLEWGNWQGAKSHIDHVVLNLEGQKDQALAQIMRHIDTHSGILSDVLPIRQG